MGRQCEYKRSCLWARLLWHGPIVVGFSSAGSVCDNVYLRLMALVETFVRVSHVSLVVGGTLLK